MIVSFIFSLLADQQEKERSLTILIDCKTSPYLQAFYPSVLYTPHISRVLSEIAQASFCGIRQSAAHVLAIYGQYHGTFDNTCTPEPPTHQPSQCRFVVSRLHPIFLDHPTGCPIS